MALVSAVRVPASRRAAVRRFANSARTASFVWAAFLALLVGGPWLSTGYLFGTDWPGPRRYDLQTVVSSSVLLKAILAGASWLIGGEATGKLFVLGLLFAATTLAYRAVPVDGFLARAVGSTVYL